MIRIIFHLIAFTALMFLPACDRIEVENQISGKKQTIVTLQARNLQLINEVKDLTAQVARLNANQPDGMILEELRKALTLKESKLQNRENRIVSQEESLRLSIVKMDKLQRKFYAETGVKLEAIGEARQIKKEYDNMSSALDIANNRANNWLIYISVLIVAFVVSIVYLIFTGMRYSSQNRAIENAMQYLEAGDLDNRNKQMIASYLGKSLKAQSKGGR